MSVDAQKRKIDYIHDTHLQVTREQHRHFLVVVLLFYISAKRKVEVEKDNDPNNCLHLDTLHLFNLSLYLPAIPII